MAKNATPLFLYIEKENITIDKTEYEFQMQSHPDYPSLLAISDTLNFLNIKTFVARIGFEDIDNLPDKFIAQLNTELSSPQLYLIEKTGNVFFYIDEKKASKIEKEELEKRWTDIILLLEKSENEEILKPNKSNATIFLQTLFLLLFGFVLSQLEGDNTTKFFLIFPCLGLFFSFAALKELFGVKSELLSNFCNITSSTSCDTVVGSAKWRIFKIVSFSDLSIVFFGSQFLGLLFFFDFRKCDDLFCNTKGTTFINYTSFTFIFILSKIC